ncbi:MAG: hypothetical protein NTX61_18310 [Bacteroidetes bacterium]|nr:hypothetical protein [Bacteroidota bacterium]
MIPVIAGTTGRINGLKPIITSIKLIGLGYNLFLDTDERFGFYYTLDYIISQSGYKTGTPDFKNNSWTTQYVWNNLSTFHNQSAG